MVPTQHVTNDLSFPRSSRYRLSLRSCKSNQVTPKIQWHLSTGEPTARAKTNAIEKQLQGLPPPHRCHATKGANPSHHTTTCSTPAPKATSCCHQHETIGATITFDYHQHATKGAAIIFGRHQHKSKESFVIFYPENIFKHPEALPRVQKMSTKQTATPAPAPITIKFKLSAIPTTIKLDIL